MTTKTTRRAFLSTASATGVAILASPAIATSKTRSASEVIIGEGAHRYRVVHQWAQLPSPYTWQTTHNVAVDSNNHLYVIHEGLESKVDHPSIFVFDERGKLIRSFGQELQGGGHGLEVRKEGSEEFLYVTGYQKIKLIAKMTLQGKTVWSKKAPTASGKYNTEEYDARAVWGGIGFCRPTSRFSMMADFCSPMVMAPTRFIDTTKMRSGSVVLEVSVKGRGRSIRRMDFGSINASRPIRASWLPIEPTIRCNDLLLMELTSTQSEDLVCLPISTCVGTGCWFPS